MAAFVGPISSLGSLPTLVLAIISLFGLASNFSLLHLQIPLQDSKEKPTTTTEQHMLEGLQLRVVTPGTYFLAVFTMWNNPRTSQTRLKTLIHN
jgi:hypothetical protein